MQQTLLTDCLGSVAAERSHIAKFRFQSEAVSAVRLQRSAAGPPHQTLQIWLAVDTHLCH